MKRWVVWSWVNGVINDCWNFEDKEESLKFYKEKVHNLNKERIKENRQSVTKLKNNDEWGYTWMDSENKCKRLNAFKTWRGVKEERRLL